MLYGVVGAVVVAGAVAAYVMRPDPAPNPVPVAAVISDVRLTATDTIRMLNGGAMSADYLLLGRESDRPPAGADSLLRVAGDRVILLSSDTTIVRVDSAHQTSGRFYLQGLRPGVARISPVLLRANGDSVGSRQFAAVRVEESEANFKRAWEAFHAVEAAARDSSVSDSTLLQRVVLLDSTHGSLLRDSSRERPELLTQMIDGTRDLIATRQYADSILADSANTTMQVRYAALERYLALVGRVRSGRGPTVAADSARLKRLDPAPVGTVTWGAMCAGSRLCVPEDGLRSEVAINREISATVFFVRGSSGRLRFEWKGEDEVLTKDLSIDAPGRRYDPRTFTKPGRWDVRVLNGRNQLVFRHTFDVK
jgi:hypothetical protein